MILPFSSSKSIRPDFPKLKPIGEVVSAAVLSVCLQKFEEIATRPEIAAKVVAKIKNKQTYLRRRRRRRNIFHWLQWAPRSSKYSNIKVTDGSDSSIPVVKSQIRIRFSGSNLPLFFNRKTKTKTSQQADAGTRFLTDGNRISRQAKEDG